MLIWHNLDLNVLEAKSCDGWMMMHITTIKTTVQALVLGIEPEVLYSRVVCPLTTEAVVCSRYFMDMYF
jgi:hypothetical protein